MCLHDKRNILMSFFIVKLKGTISSHLRIYSCPDALRDELQALLTFENPQYLAAARFSPWGAGRVEKYVSLFEEFEEYVQLPRGFKPYKRLTPTAEAQWRSVVWQDLRTKFNVKFPSPLLKLNDDQEKTVKRFKEVQEKRLRKSGVQLYVLPTSAGKTITQAYLASLTGQRTLVLCKTALIQRAWRDDLKKLFGIDKSELGHIQQKSFKVGKHFTIASIATLARRKHLWHELFSQVGCVILDECQVCGARTVREIVEACPSQYFIGMSATPDRKDAPYLVNELLGRPLLRIHNKQEETQSSYPLAGATVFKTNLTYADENGKPLDREDLIYNDLAKAISNSKDRDLLICEKVVSDWKKGHSVLVTTRRIEHVFSLKKQLKKMGLHDVNHITGEVNGDTFYMDKLLKAVSNKTCRCIVATEQAISVGANIPALDRLHVAFPPSSPDLLEQLIGRIRRKHPSKKDARLTYYMDVRVPYLFRKFKTVFVPVMRKLKVREYENYYIA